MRGGRPFDAALDGALAGLADLDRRLAHELAAGVLRQQSTLDASLAPLVRQGLTGTAPDILDVLRLGAYQLDALDRVPAHAAVNTSVALARETAGSSVSGFTNAVLRRLARTPRPSAPPADGAPSPDDRSPIHLAERHSHPLWLVGRWNARWGPDATAALLTWNNTRPRLVLQPARREPAELVERWRGAGIPVSPAPFGAGLLTDRTRPEELPGYDEGAFIVQDPAQALLCRFADLPPDAVLYDACAAPGGKTIALGRSLRLVIAGDVNRRRVHRLATNLRRAGGGREWAVVADARHPPLAHASAVLLDAPCLGTGTFARHPDARWRVTPEQLDELVALQASLLDAVAGTVAPDGLLVYATCSLEPEENDLQVERFLVRHPVFRREPPSVVPFELLSPEGDLTLHPHRHAVDGAYAARLRRCR